MAEITRALHTIDATINAVQPRCLHCNGPMDHSPSMYFCKDECQRFWNAKRNSDDSVSIFAEPPADRVPEPAYHPADTALSPEAYHAAWAKYREEHPPGPFESLFILIRRALRGRHGR